MGGAMSEQNFSDWKAGPGAVAASDQHVSEMSEVISKAGDRPSVVLVREDDGSTQLFMNFAGSVGLPDEWEDNDPRIQRLMKLAACDFLMSCARTLAQAALEEMLK